MSLTKEYIEKMLGQPISNFQESAGANLGDNVAGTLKRLKVTTASGKTLNLVYKGPPETAEGQQYAEQFGIFRTETCMYQTVNARITALLKSRDVQRTELPLPNFFSGQFGTKEDYLLLEDVRPEGYIMPDKFKGLNLSEVTLIMKEMARLHASTHFWIKYEGEKIFDESEALTALRDPQGFKDESEIKAISSVMFKNEVRNTIEILKTQNLAEWAQKVQNIVDSSPEAVYQLFMKTRKLTDAKVFPCIVHGDLWLNNIMIKYDASGNAIDLKFLDFQQSRRGNIFEDLEYFFLCSTTPEFRKEHFPQVLNIYYDAFVSSLEEFKCPVPIGFTRGSLIDTFYECLLPAYIYMAFAIPLQLAEPLDFAAMAKAAGERNGVAGGPPPPGPESGLSPAEMMLQGLTMRSKMLLGQMMKSPKALDRLVGLTREMVELKVI